MQVSNEKAQAHKEKDMMKMTTILAYGNLLLLKLA